jgi:hypothetical protein
MQAIAKPGGARQIRSNVIAINVDGSIDPGVVPNEDTVLVVPRDYVSRPGSCTANDEVITAYINAVAGVTQVNCAGHISADKVSFDAVRIACSSGSNAKPLAVAGNQVARSNERATDQVCVPRYRYTRPISAGDGSINFGSNEVALDCVSGHM